MNLVEMYKGLSPEQTKELTDRIQKAVEREYQSFTKGTPMNEIDRIRELTNKLAELEQLLGQQSIANWKPPQKWNPFTGQFEDITPPQAGPPPFSEEQFNAATERLNREMEEAERSGDFARMREIDKQLDAQLRAFSEHQQQQEQARLAQFDEERGKIHADLANLNRQSESAMQSGNFEEMKKIQAEIEVRQARENAILDGTGSLQWKGE